MRAAILAMVVAASCSSGPPGPRMYGDARASVGAACAVLCERRAHCGGDADVSGCTASCVATTCADPCDAKTCSALSCDLPPSGSDDEVESCLTEAADDSTCEPYITRECAAAVTP